MRSRADEWRRRVELAGRLGAIVLLGWALGLALRPERKFANNAQLDAEELPEALRRWATGRAPDSVHLRLDSVPDAVWRDWLVALRRTGTAVGWSGTLAPLAIAVEPVNAPAGGARLLIAGSAGDSVAVRDAIGPFDTLHLAGTGGAVRVPALAEPAQAEIGAVRARAVSADSLLPATVLVIGTAGWEARYAIAALEESGWQVDARLTIGPGLTVRRGTAGAADTARYAAVVALDSAAADESRSLVSFARAGGGLVLSGIAARLPALRGIVPGQPGARVRPAVVSFTAETPRRALGFYPVSRPRADAVVLETRDGAATVAARREGPGRVVQLGYDDSWRWRMQGGEGGMEAHRRWWTSLVASAALVRGNRRESSGTATGAAAPLVAVVAALGESVPRLESSATLPGRTGPRGWMLVLSLLLLLVEWTSRRLRGAP
jgi:hypothetical protein